MGVTVEDLGRMPILEELNSDQLERLAGGASVHAYEPGDTVFREGDRLPSGFPILASGALQMVKTSITGRETVLRLLRPGEYFAWPALLDGGLAPATAQVLAPSDVVFLPRATLLALFTEAPDFGLRVMMQISQRLREMHDRVHDLTAERARTRLARLLLRFAQAEGEQLQSRLPHDRLARMTGITYDESVRILGEWSRATPPLLTYRRGGRIVLTHVAGLEAIALGHEP